jgi:RNA polymerase sigma-70 factor, ECF subfamily
MTPRSVAEITQLLQAWGDGDERALDQLMPLDYEELRRAARRYMAYQPPGHTLQTTALVNEVYLRLVNFREVSFQHRAHFFAVCAKLMRRVLIDFARRRQYQKRGGGARRAALDDAVALSREVPANLLAVDDALKALAAVDARKSRVSWRKPLGRRDLAPGSRNIAGARGGGREVYGSACAGVSGEGAGGGSDRAPQPK